jgi:hypothetical protein
MLFFVAVLIAHGIDDQQVFSGVDPFFELFGGNHIVAAALNFTDQLDRTGFLFHFLFKFVAQKGPGRSCHPCSSPIIRNIFNTDL